MIYSFAFIMLCLLIWVLFDRWYLKSRVKDLERENEIYKSKANEWTDIAFSYKQKYQSIRNVIINYSRKDKKP